MLSVLRKKKTAKKIWIGLAIIIVPAFVFWGFSSVLRSQKEVDYAGKIFGNKISVLEYKDAYSAVETQMKLQLGDNFDELRKYINLEQQAWDRLILLYEANKRNIRANDQEVSALIMTYPIFWRNGKFDKNIYYERLVQPRMFEEQIRQNLMLSKLYNQVTQGIKTSEEKIREEYRKLNEEISVDYIASLPSEFAKEINPQEKEIKEYFDKNSLQFKQPLSFNLEYLISDSEEKIKAADSRLIKKDDFTKTSKDTGTVIKETGLFKQMDPIPGIGWSQEISNLISNLKVGEISRPIRLDKNYYILRLKEKKDPYIPEFQTIKDRVKEAFIKEKSKVLAGNKIEDCLNKLKSWQQSNPKAIDFGNAAREFALKSDATTQFKFGSYIEGIGASDNFWSIANGLKENEFSQIITLPTGFYIIKVKSKIPVDEKKFAADKEEFEKNILSQKKQERFAEFVEELKRKAQ